MNLERETKPLAFRADVRMYLCVLAMLLKRRVGLAPAIIHF